MNNQKLPDRYIMNTGSVKDKSRFSEKCVIQKKIFYTTQYIQRDQGQKLTCLTQKQNAKREKKERSGNKQKPL